VARFVVADSINVLAQSPELAVRLTQTGRKEPERAPKETSSLCKESVTVITVQA
jgi:hypothetical protein